jgi:uncharacterized protein YndB with AHSA1/START domain
MDQGEKANVRVLLPKRIGFCYINEKRNNMKHSYAAKKSVVVNAPAAKVWQALTRPEMVKQYLFGTDLTADWRVGGALTYRGQWEGKPYEDKGTVLAFQPEKLLKTTYFSSFSGLEDRPENYNTVTYKLSEKKGRTTLAVSQDNNRTRESAEHSAKNWAMVLDALKKMLET